MGNIVKHNEVYNLPCVTFVRVNVSYGNVLKIVFCTRRMKMMVSVSTAHDRPLWTRVLLAAFSNVRQQCSVMPCFNSFLNINMVISLFLSLEPRTS